MTMRKLDLPVLPASADSEPALRALWQAVFGDTDAEIGAFFDAFYDPSLTLTAYDGQTLASSAYILPCGFLSAPGGLRLPCAMLYAIGTHPDYRGLGLGSRVTITACQHAQSRGYDAVVLHPASADLFAFYARLGFEPIFDTAEHIYDAAQLPTPDARYALTPATPDVYQALRRRFLSGTVFVDMDWRGLTYQQNLCAQSGGALLAVTDGGKAVGCAAVEGDGSDFVARELLVSDNLRIEDASALIAARYGCQRLHVRTPVRAENQGADVRPFGMLSANSPVLDRLIMQDARWYGLAFD